MGLRLRSSSTKLASECLRHKGEARIPKAVASSIALVANVLNIAWLKEALEYPARIICPREVVGVRDLSGVRGRGLLGRGRFLMCRAEVMASASSVEDG